MYMYQYVRVTLCYNFQYCTVLLELKVFSGRKKKSYNVHVTVECLYFNLTYRHMDYFAY